jgi:hypothetical protein
MILSNYIENININKNLFNRKYSIFKIKINNNYEYNFSNLNNNKEILSFFSDFNNNYVWVLTKKTKFNKLNDLLENSLKILEDINIDIDLISNLIILKLLLRNMVNEKNEILKEGISSYTNGLYQILKENEKEIIILNFDLKEHIFLNQKIPYIHFGIQTLNNINLFHNNGKLLKYTKYKCINNTLIESENGNFIFKKKDNLNKNNLEHVSLNKEKDKTIIFHSIITEFKIIYKDLINFDLFNIDTNIKYSNKINLINFSTKTNSNSLIKKEFLNKTIYIKDLSYKRDEETTTKINLLKNFLNKFNINLKENFSNIEENFTIVIHEKEKHKYKKEEKDLYKEYKEKNNNISNGITKDNFKKMVKLTASNENLFIDETILETILKEFLIKESNKNKYLNKLFFNSYLNDYKFYLFKNKNFYSLYFDGNKMIFNNENSELIQIFEDYQKELNDKNINFTDLEKNTFYLIKNKNNLCFLFESELKPILNNYKIKLEIENTLKNKFYKIEDILNILYNEEENEIINKYISFFENYNETLIEFKILKEKINRKNKKDNFFITKLEPNYFNSIKSENTNLLTNIIYNENNIQGFGYYFVNGKDSIKDKIEKSSRLKLFFNINKNNSYIIDKNILDMCYQDFVKSKDLNVLPYPFKFLNEYFNIN